MTWFTRTTTHPTTPALAPARTVAERQAVLAASAAERARHAREQPPLEARVQRLAVRVAEARRLLAEALELHAEADAGRLAASLQSDQRVAQLERQLREGASEAIDRFVAEVDAEIVRTRLAFEAREAPSYADPISGARGVNLRSNTESVERRLQALGSARQAAEAMTLEALSEAEVAARLEALLAAVPEVEPVVMDPADQMSPAERRAVEWRAAEANGRRWSKEAWR
jgi:hypothetical protein